jgi:hypothetical protein
MSLALNLLKEINQQPFGMSIVTRTFLQLIEQLRNYRPGAIYSSQDKSSYQLDFNLNEARDSFLQALSDKNCLDRLNPEDCEYISATLKLVLNLGIVRSNVEDFLNVLQLLFKHSEKLNFIDITEEL